MKRIIKRTIYRIINFLIRPAFELFDRATKSINTATQIQLMLTYQRIIDEKRRIPTFEEQMKMEFYYSFFQ
jgi:hypothetical protein